MFNVVERLDDLVGKDFARGTCDEVLVVTFWEIHASTSGLPEHDGFDMRGDVVWHIQSVTENRREHSAQLHMMPS